MQEKEQESALLEVNLLKNLNHPNIVAYKTSFVTQGILVIIMEYCDGNYIGVNQLQLEIYLIISRESFLIMRGFQRLKYSIGLYKFVWLSSTVHGRKVLHRDLKTQNIFLTGNNTVKLGDFGISKVLENTNNVAMTVVGTPYYMSPEVCQNQPYTFKSDVWALGCVLYELCTLKHAFSADNLLGLVYKIVQDKFEDIPTCYSKDLSNLIHTLLNKNAQERPSVGQILQMPIVRQKMLEFVQSGGQTMPQKKPIFVKNAPTLVNIQEQNVQVNQPRQQPQKQPSNDNDKFLTPKERLAKKKEEEARKKMEEMKLAAKDAHINNARAQERKFNELYAGASQKKMNFNDTTVHNPQYSQGAMQQTVYHNQIPQPNFNPQPAQQIQGTNKFEGSMTGFDANDRTFELSESMGTQLTFLSAESTQHPANFSPSKFNNPYTDYGDNRVISAKGQYDLADLNDDFDIQEDLNEITAAKENKEELNDVLENYQRILSGAIQQPVEASPTKRGPMEVQQAAQKQNKTQMMSNNLMAIKNALGEQLFNDVYDFLKYHRRKGTDEKFMQQEIKNMVGGNRQLLNHCFQLDGIVFMEQLNS